VRLAPAPLTCYVLAISADIRGISYLEGFNPSSQSIIRLLRYSETFGSLALIMGLPWVIEADHLRRPGVPNREVLRYCIEAALKQRSARSVRQPLSP